MRSTWHSTQVILLCFVGITLFIGCGRKDLQENGSDDTQAATPLPAEPSPVDPILADPDFECILSSLTDTVEDACTRVLFQNAVLADRSTGGAVVQLTASKKNGGTGGSRWFNSRATLADKPSLVLPSSVSAVGNAGNGQKLYILFNSKIDCAWYSNAKTEYRSPRCFEGATRDAAASTGFSGGVEVAADEIVEVLTIIMSVNGAAGGGVVTTATAEFSRR